MSDRPVPPPPGAANAVVSAIIKPLVGLSVIDAASYLVVALSEVVDQADDRHAAWEAILCAIAAERTETIH